MAEKKISQLTAKTTELQKEDLLNVSEWNGATYDTKSISGEGFILNTKVSLTAAQIKTANSVPVSLIAAPGVGKFIEVISASWRFNYGSATFDNLDIMYLKINGSTQDQFRKDSMIGYSSDKFGSFDKKIEATDSLKDNASLTWVADADSTTGDSTMDIYINYRIITL